MASQQVRPFIELRYGRQNQPIRVAIDPLLVDPPAQTYLISNAAAGDVSLNVQNVTNFAVNQAVLIGDPGNGNSEIVYIASITSPSTLGVSVLKYAHTSSATVAALRFDQIQFFSAATATGAKTQLGSNASIVANEIYTQYNDVAGTSGYYFARFRDSLGSLASSYSDPSPVAGYSQFSARAIIDAALGMINKQTSTVLTDEFAFQMLDAGQMEVLREFKRWSFMQSFDSIIGTTAQGTWKVAAPTDLDDQNTYKTIWNFRIGREFDMVWVGKDEFDSLIQGMAYSTVAADTLAGASTISFISTKDFTAQGSVQVGSNVYSFTGNDTTNNILTLGSSLVANVAANQDVFQFASLGYPTYWTIWNGYIYHWPITSASYAGRNYWMDYYKKLVPITSDYQEIVLPDPTVMQYYLGWKFLLRINNGEETTASKGFYDNFILRLNKMKQKESNNRNFIFSPDLGNY